MSNVTIANYATPASNDTFNAVWKLTRALKKAGWTYKASADGTTKDTTGAAGSDKWGGNIDPLLDTIPALANGCWWCAKGPSTLKLPITAAITGNFVRGENVVQAVTGAEGEVLGAVFDTGTGTGWVVIAPRVDGSGADPRGWDHANAITGALSGATFTSSATVIEFVTEIVFWKGASNIAGTWYFQCVDQSSEAASRFSILASSAGCSATIAPGGGGTGNTFPTVGSWVPGGTGGSQTPRNWVGSQTPTATSIGKCQFMVANCTPAPNISADGSFIMALGQPGVNSGSFNGFSLQRLDDTEEGDVCPFVTVAPSTVSVDTALYNTSSGDTSLVDTMWSSNVSTGNNPGTTLFRSWRRRGMPSGDAFVACVGAYLAAFGASIGACTALFHISATDAERAASDPSAFLIAEPIWVGSVTNLRKTRKGTLRWLLLVPTGAGCDTWANKSYMQLAGFGGNVIPMIGGPWDGSSSPVNA